MRRHGSRLIPVDDIAAESLASVPANKDLMVKVTALKNPKLMRFLWALASKVAEACDHLHDREDAMDALKIAVKHVKYIASPLTGEVRIVPKSLSKLDGAGLSRLADRMIFVICKDIVPGLDETALKAEIMTMVSGDTTQSEGSCPVQPGNDKPVSTQTACDEGESNDGASARRIPGSDSTGSLANDIATTQRGDLAPPGPSEHSTLPDGWERKLCGYLDKAASADDLVRIARFCFSELGATPSIQQDIDTAKAIRAAYKDNFGDKDAIAAAIREIV